MDKKILLINPWIYDFAAYDFWIKPLGILLLAALLRQDGCLVAVIDCLDSYASPQGGLTFEGPKRHDSGHGKYFKEEVRKPEALQMVRRRYRRYGIPPAVFRERLREHADVDAVFISSMMTYWYPGVWEAIRIVRDACPRVPVVLGGNYATLCPEHAANAGADVVSCGRGEDQLPALLEELFGIKTTRVAEREELDALPYPAYDLLRRRDHIAIITSRGCPYRCSYCASTLLGGTFRQRDPDKVVAEMKFWHTCLGIRHFTFYDDALLVNACDMAVPMMKQILRSGLACDFHCPNGLHAREITEEIAGLFYRVGFRTIRIGFETADATRQEATGGKVDNALFKEAVRFLRKAGYEARDIGVYLLCGMPGQEAGEVEESIRYVLSCGARPIIAEYSPIPGTDLWPEAIASSPFPLDKEPLFHNNTLLPCGWDGLTESMYRSLRTMTRS